MSDAAAPAEQTFRQARTAKARQGHRCRCIRSCLCPHRFPTLRNQRRRCGHPRWADAAARVLIRAEGQAHAERAGS